jgi:hypothetical protein
MNQGYAMDGEMSWCRKWRRELAAGGLVAKPMWRATVAYRGRGNENFKI